MYNLREKVKTAVIMGVTGLGLTIAGETTDNDIMKALGYGGMTGSVVVAVAVGCAGLVDRERPYKTFRVEGQGRPRTGSNLNDLMDRYEARMDPEERLRRYGANATLRDLKRERFERRFGEYAEVGGNVAGRIGRGVGSFARWLGNRRNNRRAQRQAGYRTEERGQRQYETENTQGQAQHQGAEQYQREAYQQRNQNEEQRRAQFQVESRSQVPRQIREGAETREPKQIGPGRSIVIRKRK